jgi:hypothetical protein
VAPGQNRKSLGRVGLIQVLGLMERLLATLFVLTSVAGCAQFPTCDRVANAPGWVAVPPSEQTEAARRSAVGAGMLDSGFAHGDEAFFLGPSGNYLLCAIDCSEVAFNSQYSVHFRRTNNKWWPTWGPEPKCPR